MRKLLVLTFSVVLLGVGLAIGCGEGQKVTKPKEYAPMPESTKSSSSTADPAGKTPAKSSSSATPLK